MNKFTSSIIISEYLRKMAILAVYPWGTSISLSEKMFPLPNKLVKYLLKSTIGKLIEEDFDWDAVEIQLLNGTSILNDLHLNKQVSFLLTSSFCKMLKEILVSKTAKSRSFLSPFLTRHSSKNPAQ